MYAHTEESTSRGIEPAKIAAGTNAGQWQSAVRTPHYLTPLKLAGQKVRFGTEVTKLQKAVKKEFSLNLIRQQLGKYLPFISAFDDVDLVHAPDLDNVLKAAQSANSSNCFDALEILINTAISNLKHDIADSIKSTFSGIDGLSCDVDKLLAKESIYGISLGSDPHQHNAPVQLRLSAECFMESFDVGLPLTGEGAALTPFIWNTLTHLVRRGGGIACNDIYGYARQVIEGHDAEAVRPWLEYSIAEIESLPSDSSIAHLFEHECPKVRDFITELRDTNWVFEESDDVDELCRDSVLGAMQDALGALEAVSAHTPYTQGAPTEKQALYNAVWPEHPVSDKLRALLHWHCSQEWQGLDSFDAAEDMLYPFSFILHPANAAFCGAQQKILDGICQEAMEVGEGFEVYKLDVNKGQWLSDLKGYITNTFATLLAYQIATEYTETVCGSNEGNL